MRPSAPGLEAAAKAAQKPAGEAAKGIQAMTDERRRCRGTNAEGETCASPAVDPNGFCDAHRPGSEQVMAERGRRGVKAGNRGRGPEGIDEGELPEIDSLEDAEQFCAAVAGDGGARPDEPRGREGRDDGGAGVARTNRTETRRS